MKGCLMGIVLLNLYLVDVHCNALAMWHPKYLTEIITNKTKDFSDSVKEKTSGIGQTINNYVDEAKKKKDEIQDGIHGFIINTGQRVSRTFNEYLQTAKNTKTEVVESVNVHVLNTKILTKFVPEIYLDTAQLIAKSGYPAESHTVVTEDGYILTMHRIPHAKAAPAGSAGHQAVLLQHGLLASSSNYVTSGSERGLAYILAEAGYDVWMGNFRGNTYSRAHISLSTDDAAFWNFTWHESAIYDLPAMIDYINIIKKSDNDLLYVGHSMGSTALFALLSTRPEYNNKLKAAFSMAPIAFMTSVKSPIKMLAPFANNIEWIAEFLGTDEFVPQNIIFKWLASYGCIANRYSEQICRNALFILTGFDEKEFDQKNFPIILSHTPAGTSTKTVVHFAQEIRDGGKFQRFDYGAKDNFALYGQCQPPEYPVDKITLPIALICSANDWLSSLQDSQSLYEKLPNPIEYYEVPMKEFNHLDFIWGIDAPTLVYEKLQQLMKKFNSDERFQRPDPIFKFKWSAELI